MAGFYHCSVKPVGRANGRSIVAAAAYRSGERLEDARTGETFDFRARGGVLDTFIVAGETAPAWAQDRARLWNAAEAAEPRANGRLATELELALPHELTRAQRRELLTGFVREIVERHGVAADVAIHVPGKDGDHRNHHAHILITHRELGPEGFGEIANTRTVTRKRKGREVEERIAGIAATPADVKAIRQAWERDVNRAYERAGLDIRVDHRSHEDRGIAAEPSKHLGPAASGMERREPGSSDRGAANRETAQRNAARAEITGLERQVEAVQAELAAVQHFDRDAAESAWLDAVNNAAVAKAEAEPETRAGELDGDAVRAMREAQRGAEHELSGTAAHIRMAWALSNTASELQEGLAAHGIRLAHVSPEEAYASERHAALAKAAGNFAPVWREGEIVAVDGRGSVYRLAEHTTGDTRAEIEGRLVGIDRAALMDVAATQEATRAASLAAWREKVRPPSVIETRIADCAHAAGYGALVDRDPEGKTLTGAEALQARQEGRSATATVRGAEAFAAHMAAAGLTLARATEADVAALKGLRHEAELQQLVAETNGERLKIGRFAEVEEAGDLVAVTGNGDVFRVNIDKAGDAARYLPDALPSVVEARAAVAAEAERVEWFYAHRRADARDARADWDESQAAAAAARLAPDIAAAPEAAVHAAFKETERAGLHIAARAARVFEQVFGFFSGLFGGEGVDVQAARDTARATTNIEVQHAQAYEAARVDDELARDWQAHSLKTYQQEKDLRLSEILGTPPTAEANLNRDEHERERGRDRD